MKTRFRSPWDVLLIVITAGIIVLFGGLQYAASNLFITIFLWSIIFGCAAFGVYGYSIQDGKLKILRLGWSKDIELSQIRKAEYKPNAMMGSLRKFGIGGVFGYIGYFRNSILGSYKAYATHTKKTVVLYTKDEQIVLSPNNPRAFINSLHSAIEKP